jgi:hypothetical protein
MSFNGSQYEEQAILGRLDRSTPEALLTSIVGEIARVGRDLAALHAQLAALETLKAVSDRIVASDVDNFASAYPTKFTIGAAHSSLCAPEFYLLEYQGDGTPVRWTGPSRQFSFNFFLDRSRFATFSLEFERTYLVDSVEYVTCFVDGESVPITVNQNERGYLATGLLPPRADHGGSILTFVCPEMKTPQEDGSSDNRILGLRFQRLTVESRPALARELALEAGRVSEDAAKAYPGARSRRAKAAGELDPVGIDAVSNEHERV